MFNMKSVLEEEEIISFGETPSAASVTVDDVRDAEQETAEKQEEQQEKEDKQREEIEEIEQEQDNEAPADDGEVSADSLTDDEIGNLSEEQLCLVRFTPHYVSRQLSLKEEWELIMQKERTKRRLQAKLMEYGTPSGTNPIPSCPSCGDAADAVILGDEVEDSEGSVEEGGDDEASTSFDAEMRQISKFYKTLYVDKDALYGSMYLYGSEGYKEWAKGMAHHGWKLITIAFNKLVKYSILAYKSARNNFMKAFTSWQTIAKFWKHKLNDFHKVDLERFAKAQLTILPAKQWVATAKTALAACALLHDAPKVVTDRTPTAETTSIAKVRQLAEAVDINIKVGKDRLDTSGFTHHREAGTMQELNYSGQTIPACVHMFESLAKYMPKGDIDVLKESTDKALHEVTKFAAEINEDKEDGKLDPNSKEFHRLTALSVMYTARCDFILSAFRMVGIVFAELTSDLLKVCSKLEDCMISEEYT